MQRSLFRHRQSITKNNDFNRHKYHNIGIALLIEKLQIKTKSPVSFCFISNQTIFVVMKPKQKQVPAIRNKNMNFSLSEEEFNLVSAYIRKYKISNKSRWLRETVMMHVLKNLDMDYPTLFGENEMRR